MPLLIAALEDADSYVREAAADSLGRFRGRDAVAHLIESLNDPSCKVREHAARSLARMGDPEAADPLVALLSDENRDVHRSAALALGNLRDARAIEPLIALAAKDSVAQRRLKHMTGQDFGGDQAKWQEWWRLNKANPSVTEKLLNVAPR